MPECTSGDKEEESHSQEFLTNIEKNHSNKNYAFIGNIRNVQIGTSKSMEEGEFSDTNVGKHGMENADSKGLQLINFTRSIGSIAANTFKSQSFLIL